MRYIKSNFFKWLFWFILGITLIFTCHLIDFEGYFTSMLLWVDSQGKSGAIAFVVIYAVATIICIPGSILALAGGALFGSFWGAIIVFLGGFLGAVSVFSLGRYLLKNWVKHQLSKNRYLQAINRAIAAEGWKIAILLHISPIIPFNILNYALGASKLAFKDFIIATAIGIIPGVMLYTFLGSAFGDLTMIVMNSAQPRSKIQWLFSIAGVIVTITMIAYLGHVAKDKLKEKLD